MNEDDDLETFLGMPIDEVAQACADALDGKPSIMHRIELRTIQDDVEVHALFMCIMNHPDIEKNTVETITYYLGIDGDGEIAMETLWNVTDRKKYFLWSNHPKWKHHKNNINRC